jgi:hypothetical protein
VLEPPAVEGDDVELGRKLIHGGEHGKERARRWALGAGSLGSWELGELGAGS